MKEPLEQVMRRICGRYVYWYNLKYNRIGNLFQDRFKSEPVEDDAYFLTVIRYIHRNPIKKPDLVNRLDEYRWSSFNEYINNTQLIDADFALNMFSTDREKAIKLFVEHNNEQKR